MYIHFILVSSSIYYISINNLRKDTHIAKLTSKLLSKMEMQIETKNSEIDLVCGMEISRQPRFKAKHNGKTYYFCSDHCQKHFKDNPERYLGI